MLTKSTRGAKDRPSETSHPTSLDTGREGWSVSMAWGGGGRGKRQPVNGMVQYLDLPRCIIMHNNTAPGVLGGWGRSVGGKAKKQEGSGGRLPLGSRLSRNSAARWTSSAVHRGLGQRRGRYTDTHGDTTKKPGETHPAVLTKSEVCVLSIYVHFICPAGLLLFTKTLRKRGTLP